MPQNDTNVNTDNTDNTTSKLTIISLCHSCRAVLGHRPHGAERQVEPPSQLARRSQEPLSSEVTYNGQASDQSSVVMCPRCQTQVDDDASEDHRSTRSNRSSTPSPSAITTTRPSPRRQLSPETARSLMPLLDVPPRATTLRTLSRQEEMSLTGLTVQQRTALACAEKKAQRSEAAAQRSTEWTLGKGANCQKFDQLNNQMKWGKQNHKLMPR